MFAVFELDNAHANEPAMNPEYYSRRDRFITDNLLAKSQAGKHTVFCAHDGYVCNAPLSESP